MTTKNYTIISLYFSVFLIISLLTAYFPLWLNKGLQLDPKYIGYILSISGIVKAFFTIILALFIKNNNSLRNFLSYLIIFTLTLFLFIYLLKNILSLNIILIIVLMFLISFSPILPLIETLYSGLVKKSLKKYGKIRISGSLSFCLGVFLFGYFIDIYSINIFPLILICCLLLMGLSIFFIPKKFKIEKFHNLTNFKNLINENKNILLYIVVCSLLQGTHAMYYGYSTIIWERKGLEFINIGILWSFAIISEILLFLTIDYFFKPRYLYRALIFCSAISFLRWCLTYLIENFYILLIIQTLHGVTFALTHYIMIFFINSKLKQASRLHAQIIYYALAGGFFITILTISCGHILSYFKGDEGYMLMALLAFMSFLFLVIKGKLYG